MDLKVSAVLLDAMQRPPQGAERAVVVPAGVDDPSVVEEVDPLGAAGVRVLVEAPLAIRHPTISPSRYGAEGLTAELPEAREVHAALEALRAAVDQLDGEPSRNAAAAGWHAESVVRFFCSTYAVAGVRVNEEGFIVITTDVLGDEPVPATIAVGPDGTYACKMSPGGGGHLASVAPDVRAFEHVLASRLAGLGVRARTVDDRG